MYKNMYLGIYDFVDKVWLINKYGKIPENHIRSYSTLIVYFVKVEEIQNALI